MFWASELMSWCLCGSHFINWAITQLPFFLKFESHGCQVSLKLTMCKSVILNSWSFTSPRDYRFVPSGQVIYSAWIKSRALGMIGKHSLNRTISQPVKTRGILNLLPYSLNIWCFVAMTFGMWVGEMTRKLRMLVALTEDLGSVSSTHMVSQNHLWFWFYGIWCPLLIS